METRIRKQFDSDLATAAEPAEYCSTTNPHEVQCDVCGKPVFVDDDTKMELERALENGLNGGLVCFRCEEDYDELAYR
jgi:hypothetical protein